MKARRGHGKFKEDQVGSHILTNVPVATLTETVGDVRRRVFGRPKIWESVDYVYVLDAHQKLKGIASIKELLASPVSKKMSSFRKRLIASVRPHSSISIAVARAIKHNVKTVPVVDEEEHFLGMLAPDHIMEALERMHVRELFFKAGMNPTRKFSEIFEAKIGQVFRWRFPWLFSGLIGGVLLTAIMGSFHESLEEVVELAFFVPMMVYMADALGTQTQTIYIRGIAFGAINTATYLWREICIDLVIGFVSALMIGGFAMFLTGSTLITATVALAMFLVVSTAGTVAVTLAVLFKRFTRDPALGGGPLTTVIQDSLTIIIYFAVATIALSIS